MKNLLVSLLCFYGLIVSVYASGAHVLWEKTFEEDSFSVEYSGRVNVVKMLNDSAWLCGGYMEWYGVFLLNVITEKQDGSVTSASWTAENLSGPVNDIIVAHTEGFVYVLGEVGGVDASGPISYMSKYNMEGSQIWLKHYFSDSLYFKGNMTRFTMANAETFFVQTENAIFSIDSAGAVVGQYYMPKGSTISDIAEGANEDVFVSFNTAGDTYGVMRLDLSGNTAMMNLSSPAGKMRKLNDTSYLVSVTNAKVYFINSSLQLYDSLDFSSKYSAVSDVFSNNSLLFFLANDKAQPVETVFCTDWHGNHQWAFEFPPHVKLNGLHVDDGELQVYGSELLTNPKYSHAFAKSFSISGNTLPINNDVSVGSIITDSVRIGWRNITQPPLIVRDVKIYSTATVRNDGATIVDKVWLGGTTYDGPFGTSLNINEFSGLNLQPGDSVSLPVMSWKSAAPLDSGNLNKMPYHVFATSPNGSLDHDQKFNHGNAEAEFYFVAVAERKRELELNIFPVPAANELCIRFPQPLTGRLEIYNMLGENVVSASIKNESFLKVDISGQSEGNYIMRIMSQDGQINNSKFMIQR